MNRAPLVSLPVGTHVRLHDEGPVVRIVSQNETSTVVWLPEPQTDWVIHAMQNSLPVEVVE